MKKFLWLSIILSFIVASHAFADYTLNVTASGTVVNATLTGIPAAKAHDVFQLLIQKDPFPSGSYKGSASATLGNVDPTQKSPTISAGATTGSVNWSIASNPANTLLYVRVLDIPPTVTSTGTSTAKPSYITDATTITTQAATIPLVPLTTQRNSTTGDVTVTGQIDTTKTTQNPGEFSAELIYSTSSAIDSKTGELTTINGGPLPSSTIDRTTGKYTWTINGGNLHPSTTYYIQQIVTDSSNNQVFDTVDYFNSDTGNIVVPGTASALADAQKRSYTFLSNKSTILPDPDLCAQQQSEAAANGKPVPNCDINYYINLALQFLIGLCGVVLVLRLMLEGYNIMTTDVVFLRVKAKSDFMTALVGLLIALSSWIILNTINPKLVAETVNVQQLAIDIGGDTNAPTIFVPNGQKPTGVICPNSGKSSVVAQIAQSFKGKVTYSQTNKTSAAGPDGYAVLDCSSFVNTVLKCAGYVEGKDFINEGTAGIFASAERVSMPSGFTTSGSDVLINNKKLNPGDVIGWPPVSGGQGHAIIYVGNQTFYDSHGGTGRQPGNAIGMYSATDILQRFGSGVGKTITSVERMPS